MSDRVEENNYARDIRMVREVVGVAADVIAHHWIESGDCYQVHACLAMARWLDALALGARNVNVDELRAAIAKDPDEGEDDT